MDVSCFAARVAILLLLPNHLQKKSRNRKQRPATKSRAASYFIRMATASLYQMLPCPTWMAIFLSRATPSKMPCMVIMSSLKLPASVATPARAVPKGAFYAYPNVSVAFRKGIASALQFSERLLAEAHVAVVPGEAFGTSEHVRISYATSMEELRRGLERIGAFVREYSAA